jgi:hypothetical protein
VNNDLIFGVEAEMLFNDYKRWDRMRCIEGNTTQGERLFAQQPLLCQFDLLSLQRRTQETLLFFPWNCLSLQNTLQFCSLFLCNSLSLFSFDSVFCQNRGAENYFESWKINEDFALSLCLKSLTFSTLLNF